MKQTYLCADLNLFNDAAARHNLQTSQEYNQFIIDRINTVAKTDDFLMLFGNITEGTINETKQFLSQLKATWDIVDLKDQPLIKLEEFWKSMGARKAITLDGFIGGTIDKEQTNVIISTCQSNIPFWLGGEHYIALAESSGIKNELLKENELYKDKIYNISLSAHDYKPVLINQIPWQINEYLKLSKGDI